MATISAKEIVVRRKRKKVFMWIIWGFAAVAIVLALWFQKDAVNSSAKLNYLEDFLIEEGWELYKETGNPYLINEAFQLLQMRGALYGASLKYYDEQFIKPKEAPKELSEAQKQKLTQKWNNFASSVGLKDRL